MSKVPSSSSGSYNDCLKHKHYMNFFMKEILIENFVKEIRYRSVRGTLNDDQALGISSNNVH